MPIFKQALSVFLSMSVMISVLGLDGCSKKPEDRADCRNPASVPGTGAGHDLRGTYA